MASSMLGVDLTIDDFPTLLNYLDQLIQKAPAAQKAMRKAFRGVTPTVTVQPGRSTNVNTPGGTMRIVVVLQGNTGLSTRGVRSQQTSPTARRQSSRTPGVYGAAQRHRDLQRDLHDPAVVADRARFQDTLRAFRSNEKRMNGSSLGDKVNTLIRSTRINAGPVSPLIGRTLDVIEDVLGPEGKQIMEVARAAAAAAAALFLVAKSSADVGNSFSSLQIATGSGIATTSELTRLGAGLGMSPEQTAAAAQTLQDRITSDPAARATGLHLGVYNLPGPYGNQDYGGQLEVVLKNLSRESQAARIRDTRVLGIPESASLPASAKVQGALDLTASTRTELMKGPFLQDSRDFGVAMDNVGAAFGNFLAAVGPTVLPEITNFLLELAQVINNLAKAIQDNRPLFDVLYGIVTQPAKSAIASNPLTGLSNILRADGGLYDKGLQTIDNTIGTNFRGPFDKGLQTIDNAIGTHFLGGNDSQDAQTAALQKNTDALERSTAAHQLNKRYAVPGVYGTFGDRGNGLPSGVNGQSISRATLDLSLF